MFSSNTCCIFLTISNKIATTHWKFCIIELQLCQRTKVAGTPAENRKASQVEVESSTELFDHCTNGSHAVVPPIYNFVTCDGWQMGQNGNQYADWWSVRGRRNKKKLRHGSNVKNVLYTTITTEWFQSNTSFKVGLIANDCALLWFWKVFKEYQTTK